MLTGTRSSGRATAAAQTFVFSQIAETVKAQNYEFDSLVLSISLPAQLCVREVSGGGSSSSESSASLTNCCCFNPAAFLLAPREEGSEVRERGEVRSEVMQSFD